LVVQFQEGIYSVTERNEAATSLAGEKELRVLFLGMLGDFSRIPLAALLAAGVDVCGVLIPAAEDDGRSAAIIRQVPPSTPSEVPLIAPYLSDNIVRLAWVLDILPYAVNPPGPGDTLAAVNSLPLHLACVVCFH
jgi:hypothetical protein